MTVDSRFNFKVLRHDLLAAVFGVVAFLWSFVKSDISWALALAVLAGVALVVAIGWLARLKRILTKK